MAWNHNSANEERVVSWREIRQELEPDPEDPPDFQELAAEMHRFRGLVMAQCAETEAVLGQIVRALDPQAKIEVPAGVLLKALRKRMPAELADDWNGALQTIDDATSARNHAVHSDIEIGSTWMAYATGGGS